MISICAIFKNEYSFILEWIAYHRCLGIHNFYIADNISSDGSSELLSALDKIHILNRIEYPTESGVAPQIGAYNKLLGSAEGEWLAFIDADEFITPQNYEEGFSELCSLLQDEEISAIALNWAVYGSSHSIIPENLLVIERLNKRASQDHPVNLHYKSIVRKKNVVSTGKTPHEFVLSDGQHYIKTSGISETENNGRSKKVDWDKARINHYVIKSKSEFITKKVARGRATTLEKELNRTISFFRGHDLNQVEENIPRWFLNKVINEKLSIIEKLRLINYQYHESKSLNPLYRTAYGMGKGHIDIVNITHKNIEIRGWAINRNNKPVNEIIAVVNSYIILNCSKILFRDRLDLARAGLELGDGLGAGFNALLPLPDEKIMTIDFYGLDNNGLVITDIKSNINILNLINKPSNTLTN